MKAGVRTTDYVRCKVHLRQTKRGRRARPVTKCGRVTETETKPNEPTRVKTDTCHGKFREDYYTSFDFYDFK